MKKRNQDQDPRLSQRTSGNAGNARSAGISDSEFAKARIGKGGAATSSKHPNSVSGRSAIALLYVATNCDAVPRYSDPESQLPRRYYRFVMCEANVLSTPSPLTLSVFSTRSVVRVPTL